MINGIIPERTIFDNTPNQRQEVVPSANKKTESERFHVQIRYTESMSFGLPLSLTLLLGCSSKALDTGSTLECTVVDENDVTWANWGQGFFMTWCQACHSATATDRHGAPSGIDFDTQTEVMAWKERIVVRVLDQQTMPLGGGLSAEDLELLERYFNNVRCR